MRLKFKNFPIPPSENQLYRNLAKVGRVKTRAYREYTTEVEAWHLSHLKPIKRAKAYIDPKIPLKVEFRMMMNPTRLFTKDGRIKRLDASNRIKAMLDLFSGCLEIDDSIFFSCKIEKIACTDEGVDIMVSYL